jgi:hypothetical protein
MVGGKMIGIVDGSEVGRFLSLNRFFSGDDRFYVNNNCGEHFE